MSKFRLVAVKPYCKCKLRHPRDPYSIFLLWSQCGLMRNRIPDSILYFGLLVRSHLYLKKHENLAYLLHTSVDSFGSSFNTTFWWLSRCSLNCIHYYSTIIYSTLCHYTSLLQWRIFPSLKHEIILFESIYHSLVLLWMEHERLVLFWWKRLFS